MNIEKAILKAAKKESVTINDLADAVGVSVNKLLNGLAGERLLAPEKITAMGRKVKMKPIDVDKLHKMHNKKNFDKRFKQSKQKEKKPKKTDTDNTPIIR